MGDAAEGLIDADARIQERMEELHNERSGGRGRTVRDPQLVTTLESLRLARTELESQLAATMHVERKAQIGHAMAEIDRRMAETSARLG